jgi:Domain of unknown function (DUF1707)
MLSHRQASASGLRLSDVERERALGTLKGHYAEGRLSTEELEARIENVYDSRTRSDGAWQLHDLPLRGLRRLILVRVRRLQRVVLTGHLLVYASINAALVGIWALTGEGSFWPALLLLPSSALLGAHLVASRKLTRALERRWP